MLIKKPADIRPSEITPPALYRDRRRFLQISALTAAAVVLPLTRPVQAGSEFPNITPGPFSTDEEKTPYDDVINYTNFYEFGTGKSDPALYAHTLRTKPWTVTVEGECENPGRYALEDFLAPHQLEERVYRLRCVEAWSMVIPWVGFELNALLKQVEPTGNAKYVEFVTALQPDTMHGVHSPVLDWPYVEGLRIDEAMHPLTILAVGIFGEVLPNQNGAPVRLVVPWKYGFKSGKSIVKIRLVEKQPVTAWERASPSEYGFYSNVNPDVDHPRWTQKTERRIPEFFSRRPTQMFNGYGDQVAGLYTGMDLKKYF
jgi:sulfoxide reductase catalytic subunit YedY